MKTEATIAHAQGIANFSFKDPRDVIAYNFPTFADCYHYQAVDMPSFYRLRREADKLIEALRNAGFEIVHKSNEK